MHSPRRRHSVHSRCSFGILVLLASVGCDGAASLPDVDPRRDVSQRSDASADVPMVRDTATPEDAIGLDARADTNTRDARIDDAISVDVSSDTSRPDTSVDLSCVRAQTGALLWSDAGGALAGASVAGTLREGVVAARRATIGDWTHVEIGALSGWTRARFLAPAACSEPTTPPRPRPDARRVLVVIFEPRNPVTGLTAHADMGWRDPQQMTEQGVAYMEEASDGRLVYRVTETLRWEDFPVKTDGFRYDYASWRRVIAGTAPAHDPDSADYPAIIARARLCERVNSGEVQELWMFGGPYFGFGESGLVGPGGFAYNGPVIASTLCRQLTPIMGLNYERELPEMVHDWAHRTEATMSQVFGGWMEDRIAHDWDRFGLVAGQSPSLGFSGCGSAHWAPNSRSDYDYGNPRPELTMCHDFEDYPALASDPRSVLATIDCTAWGCTALGYSTWWLSHLPRATSIRNGIRDDWWAYMIDPNLARGCGSYDAEASCSSAPQCHWLCGGCYRQTVGMSEACSVCGRNVALDRCNATAGCAWYSCPAGRVQCWPTGTPPGTACGS